MSLSPIPEQLPDEYAKETEPTEEPYILSDEKIPDGTYTHFYQSVLRDIAIFALIGLLAAIYIGGIETAGGVLLGAAVSGLNFWWMKRAIVALTDVYTKAIAKEENSGSVSQKPDIPVLPQAIRFFLRYLLIGSIAFVMMKGHRSAALGFFAGFALPIAALMVEGFQHFVFASGPSQKVT